MPIRAWALLASFAALAACAPAQPPAVPAAVPPPASASVAEAGREAYERACARCHEQGTDGAPVTRRPADWAGRSHLWQAVLVEHAERGYFNMPAQGGETRLSDREVQVAAEYMLTLTHPQVPGD